MIKKNIPVWVSLTGMVVQIVGMAWAIVLFRESNAEGFTFLRNFVSELGSLQYPASARVFNGTMILSALLISPIYWALSRHIHSRLGDIALGVGVFTTICTVALGFLPMNYITPHIVAALGFFGGLMLTTLLFTIAFWRRYSFWACPSLLGSGIILLSLSGIFVVIVLLALKAAMDGVLGTTVQNPESFRRPEIWDIAVLEWCVVLALFVWNLSASIRVIMANRKAAKLAGGA